MNPLIARLLGITRSVLSFYVPLLRVLAASGVSILLPIALEVVRSLANTDKSSAEKRDEAIAVLKTSAIRQGIEASESLIRFTVESAVQRLKLGA
jgi:hypothetical protein